MRLASAAASAAGVARLLAIFAAEARAPARPPGVLSADCGRRRRGERARCGDRNSRGGRHAHRQVLDLLLEEPEVAVNVLNEGDLHELVDLVRELVVGGDEEALEVLEGLLDRVPLPR